jgi:hypothetical protein
MGAWRFTMAHRRLFAALVLAAVAGLAGCLDRASAEKASGETQEAVARAILLEEAGGEEPKSLAEEGVIMAACARFDAKGNPVPPFRVWRATGGRLASAGPDALEKALGPERSLWPPLTYVFSVEPAAGGGLQVNLVTHYRGGLAESSRGGHVQKWTLERREKRWRVKEKVTILLWD